MNGLKHFHYVLQIKRITRYDVLKAEVASIVYNTWSKIWRKKTETPKKMSGIFSGRKFSLWDPICDVMTSPHSCHVKARYIVLSRVPTVDLVSDPPTQPSKSSRDAEPSSDSAASVMLHPLHGTVFHTTSILLVTLVFSRSAQNWTKFGRAYVASCC